MSVVLSVLNGALSGTLEAGDAQAASVLTRDGHVDEASGRFHAVRWDTCVHGERWAGGLTWIHPHPVIAGVPCTTHVSIAEGAASLDLTVHVGASGGLTAVRGFVGAGQARPRFLAELNRLAIMTFQGSTTEPHEVDESGIDALVRNVLLSDRRKHPIAVLAPLEPVDHRQAPEYLVPPHEIAEELLGLAHLYVIDRHQTTFRLSDALGDRRLSCYWGALRVYMPDFSRSDSGMRHPLLVRDRIEDPVERAGMLGELGREARTRIPVPASVEELREAARPRPATPPDVDSGPGVVPADAGPVPTDPAPPIEARPAEHPAAVEEDGSKRLAEAIEEITEGLAVRLDELARGLAAKLDAVVDEVARLRTATVVRGANVAGVERRLAEFERLFRDHFEGPSAATDSTESERDDDEGTDEAPDLRLVSVLQQAAAEHADALLVLDSAIRSAAESPYEDVHRVATNLRAMADISRRRQEGRLGMSLREAFAEAGVDYRGGIARSTPKRQRLQYATTLPDGTAVECQEHVALGAGTYDPRYVLRIYFSSRAPGEPRFVIAHVGRHFEVMTTT